LLKSECIRPGTPLSLGDAQHLVQGYVAHYNNLRLNSAIGYITPKDMLAGRQQEIHSERDRKLAAARQQRQLRRQQAASAIRSQDSQRPVLDWPTFRFSCGQHLRNGFADRAAASERFLGVVRRASYLGDGIAHSYGRGQRGALREYPEDRRRYESETPIF
jgi:hypothetical protein